MARTRVPLGDWPNKTDPDILKRMFRDKLDPNYYRPTPLDIMAKTAIEKSHRSACLWYEVGAVIFYEDIDLASGYNGPSRGDVNPREVGCARVVDGKLEVGKGLCRGSHAELNAINNLTSSTLGIEPLEMMVTLHPCYSCAKQIVNKRIKKVHYIWEYGREQFVTDYLEKLGVVVSQYTSTYLEEWIKRNKYHAVGSKHNEIPQDREAG